MRHQRWKGHGGEDPPRYTAQHEFAHPRMAVTTHHKQIHGLVGCVREDRVGNVDLRRGNHLDLGLDPMASEMVANIGPGQFVAFCRLAGDHDDLGRLAL